MRDQVLHELLPFYYAGCPDFGWHGVTTTVGSPCLDALPACRHESMPPKLVSEDMKSIHGYAHDFVLGSKAMPSSFASLIQDL